MLSGRRFTQNSLHDRLSLICSKTSKQSMMERLGTEETSRVGRKWWQRWTRKGHEGTFWHVGPHPDRGLSYTGAFVKTQSKRTLKIWAFHFMEILSQDKKLVNQYRPLIMYMLKCRGGSMLLPATSLKYLANNGLMNGQEGGQMAG